jgi:hypothetical protein
MLVGELFKKFGLFLNTGVCPSKQTDHNFSKYLRVMALPGKGLKISSPYKCLCGQHVALELGVERVMSRLYPC